MRKEIKKSLIAWPLVASATLSALGWAQIQAPKMETLVTAWWKGSAPKMQVSWNPVTLADAAGTPVQTPETDIASSDRFAELFVNQRSNPTQETTYDAITFGPVVRSDAQIEAQKSALMVAAQKNLDAMESEFVASRQIAKEEIADPSATPFYQLIGSQPNEVTIDNQNDSDLPLLRTPWLARMRNTQPIAASSLSAKQNMTEEITSHQDGLIELIPAQKSLMPSSTQVLAKPLPQVDLSSPRRDDPSSRQQRLMNHSPTAWPQPTALINLLETAKASNVDDQPMVAWTDQVLVNLDSLRALSQLSDSNAGRLLDSLDQLVNQGYELANQTTDREAQRMIRQSAYALQRRVAVWQPVSKVNHLQNSQWIGDLATSQHDGRHAIEGSIDYADLLRKIERQESNPIDLVASELTASVATMRQSGIEGVVAVADAMDLHYRNANIRIAVSEGLLNRFVPKIDPRTVPLRTRVLGAQVRGVSQINSNLKLELSPSPSNWQLNLQTLGQVHTRSVGKSGPVSVRTSGTNLFVAQTPIAMSPNGLQLGNVAVDVNGNTRLRGIRSEYDKWPILGSLVRGFANSKFDSMRGRSNQIAASRVRSEVSREISTTLDNRSQEASQKIDSIVMKPLDQMQLEPKIIDMKTTQDRLLARYRLAGSTQLAAFTPRPQAPTTSLMSVQVHQSAINNTMEKLIPRQQPMPINEIFDQAAAVFGKEIELDEELPTDVVAQFAKTRPITVEIEDGKMWITLRVIKLSRGKRLNLTNFIVRAAYRPEVNGIRADLVRDGHLRISGPGMSMRERLPLRTIFNKVLSPNRPIPLTMPAWVDHPTVAGLAISQMELRSGWMGLAVSDSDAPRIAWNEEDETDLH